MRIVEFQNVLEDEIARIHETLGSKRAEYAGDFDVLHNFKSAAALEQSTPKKALAGMLAKHTVSIYDMIGSGEPFTVEQWTEKISDHINYLILLKAIVVEESGGVDDLSDWDFNESAFKLDTGPDSNVVEPKSDLCCSKCKDADDSAKFPDTGHTFEHTIEVLKLPLFPGLEILLPTGGIRP